VKKLIQYGADVNLKDNKDRTPLDLAVEKNKRNIIELLNDSMSSECCQVNFAKRGVRKTTKNHYNLFFFIAIHLLVQAGVGIIILPCN
jgi:ankyrin repeat protein